MINALEIINYMVRYIRNLDDKIGHLFYIGADRNSLVQSAFV